MSSDTIYNVKTCELTWHKKKKHFPIPYTTSSLVVSCFYKDRRAGLVFLPLPKIFTDSKWQADQRLFAI